MRGSQILKKRMYQMTLVERNSMPCTIKKDASIVLVFVYNDELK
jgi:hypothetical protein